MPNISLINYTSPAAVKTRTASYGSSKTTIPAGHEFIWNMTSAGGNDYAAGAVIIDTGTNYGTLNVSLGVAWETILSTKTSAKCIIKY